jgi:hypothetical protein
MIVGFVPAARCAVRYRPHYCIKGMVVFMSNLKRIIPALIATLAVVASNQCGGSKSPTGPAPNTTVSVALTTATITAGNTGQGTVSLTTPAPAGGSSVTLSSSNRAVATVPASVTVPAGSSSATFVITAASPGTATITASLSGSTAQSPVLTVTTQVLLSSLSIGSSNVVGGSQAIVTATLTGAAPTGGAVVTLSSGDPITVPASVTVPAGSTSAPFTIFTRVVGGTISGTITASYAGTSKSLVLAVTRPTVATASFGTTGPTQTETCELANNGTTLNCTFDGSTSTAPSSIIAWDWTYGVAASLARTTSTAVLTQPAFNCTLLPPAPLPAGSSSLNMTVTLKVHDDAGNVSAVVTDAGVRLFPQGACGY